MVVQRAADERTGINTFTVAAELIIFALNPKAWVIDTIGRLAELTGPTACPLAITWATLAIGTDFAFSTHHTLTRVMAGAVSTHLVRLALDKATPFNADPLAADFAIGALVGSAGGPTLTFNTSMHCWAIRIFVCGAITIVVIAVTDVCWRCLTRPTCVTNAFVDVTITVIIEAVTRLAQR